MGGGTSGLYPATKGAKPYQMSLMPDPIHVRHRGPAYAIETGDGTGGRGGSVAIKDRTLLLTPPDVLKECLHWRSGAISAGQLVRWIQNKLHDERYHMEPPKLRIVLKSFLPKLKATRPAGKGYDIQAFLAIIEQLEAELETM